MPQKLLEGAQHNLTYAEVRNPTDASLAPFLHACESDDATSALQLAPDRDVGALTFGLNRAVERGHLDLARKLLEMGAKWDTRTIHLASGSLEAVKLLVESGFDVNTGLIRGGTLLPIVVGRNDEACIRYLLERGANPKLGPPMITQGPISQIRPISNSGWILNRAATSCTPETFALLLSYGADISNAIPLHYAAGHGPLPHNLPSSSRIPMLEYLVGLGLDVNSLDDAITIGVDGRGRIGTPLHYAVRWGRVEEAKWLLAKGADPDKMSSYGFSARDEAKRLLPQHELAVLLRTI
ncbi:Nn.00g061290.m01.CDS01 [Neocucurbitaria sp. VM-36]